MTSSQKKKEKIKRERNCKKGNNKKIQEKEMEEMLISLDRKLENNRKLFTLLQNCNIMVAYGKGNEYEKK